MDVIAETLCALTLAKAAELVNHTCIMQGLLEVELGQK